MGFFSEMDALLQQLEEQLTKLNYELERPILPYTRQLSPVIPLRKPSKEDKGDIPDECPF